MAPLRGRQPEQTGRDLTSGQLVGQQGRQPQQRLMETEDDFSDREAEFDKFVSYKGIAHDRALVQLLLSCVTDLLFDIHVRYKNSMPRFIIPRVTFISTSIKEDILHDIAGYSDDYGSRQHSFNGQSGRSHQYDIQAPWPDERRLTGSSRPGLGSAPHHRPPAEPPYSRDSRHRTNGSGGLKLGSSTDIPDRYPILSDHFAGAGHSVLSVRLAFPYDQFPIYLVTFLHRSLDY